MINGLESEGSEYSAQEISVQVPDVEFYFMETLVSDDEISIDDEDLAEVELQTGDNRHIVYINDEDPMATAARHQVPIPILNSTFASDSSNNFPIPSGRHPVETVKKSKGRPKEPKKLHKLTNTDRRFIIHAHILDPSRSIASIRYELFHVRLQIKNIRLWTCKTTFGRIIIRWNNGIFRDRRFKLDGSGPKSDYVVTDEFCAALKLLVDEFPFGPKKNYAKVIGCSEYAVTQGLKKLKLKGYAVRKVQRLKPHHYEARMKYCARMLIYGAQFHRVKWDTDEFYLNTAKRIFWSRHVRYWAGGIDMVPEWVHKMNANAQNGPRLMVWVAVMYNRLVWYIWPEKSRINSESYCEMLEKNFFIPGVFDPENHVLQQDGSSSHVSQKTMRYLELKTDKIISLNNTKWTNPDCPFPEFPACSPDLAVCDYGIFPSVKREIWKVLPVNCTWQQAKECTESVLQKFAEDPGFINRCIDGQTKRYHECLARNGGIFEPWRKKNKKSKKR